ncbi:MAG: OmpA family protein [Gemmatimonadetes bacterium]|nr:OmpA family protein [Gemmatimonadota bacterium]
MGQPEGASSLPRSGARGLNCEERRRSVHRRRAEALPACKHHTVGRSDAPGGGRLELSDRRAVSVVAYLMKRGVDAGRLQAVGKGEANNATPEGRQQNRRVVLRVQEYGP